MDICRICYESVLCVDCEKCKLSCCRACYNLHLKECDKLVEFKYHLCERHGNQLEGYCLQCLQLTCDRCCDDNHKDHTIIRTKLAMDNIAKDLEHVSVDVHAQEIQINSLPDIKRIKRDVETKIENEVTKYQSLLSDIKTKLMSQIAEDFNRIKDPLQLHNVLNKAKLKLDSLKNQSFPIAFLSYWACFSSIMDQCEKLIKEQSEGIAQLEKKADSDFSRIFRSLMLNLDGTPVDLPCIKENSDVDSLTSMLAGFTIEDLSSLSNERSKEENADSMDSEGEFEHIDLIQQPQADNMHRQEDGLDEKQKLSEQIRQLQLENIRMQQRLRLLTEEKRFMYNVCKDINKLTEDIKNKRTTGEHITILTTENTTMNEMVKNIQLVLNRFIDANNDLVKTEQQLKRKLISIAEWTDEVRNSTEKDRQELLKEIHDKAAQIKKFETELSTTPMTHEIQSSISYLKNENKQLKVQLNCLLQENNARIIDIQKNQAETEALRHSVQTMKSQLIRKEQNLAALKQEKDNYQTRLSSVAGDKLTKGNPEITDLSDPNRPMKIYEKYGELYDNEWTDAMECTDDIKMLFRDLTIADIEEIVINHLYRLLKCCYEECLLLSQQQLHAIGTTIVDTLHLESQIRDPNLSSIPGFKDLINLRRKMGEKYATYLFENQIMSDKITKSLASNWEYAHRNEGLIKQLTKTPFFQKCVQLCWLMSIQDPVMHLSEEIKPDTVYDKTIYREFVTNGDKVRYAVWPALFLYKDGPILYKGVVQPY